MNTIMFFFCFVFLFLEEAHSEDKECERRVYGSESCVCVCNATYCDTISPPVKLDNSKFIIYTSNKAGLRFEKKIGNFLPSDLYINGLYIDRSKRYQTMLGWGAAFTDSTGINIAYLDNQTQDKLLETYFSSEGLEYNLGRVPIAGTDFSTRGYSYDDGDEDLELKNFSLQDEDFKYKIPYIKKALELRNNNLKFFAAAWSCPKWMNTQHSYDAFLGMINMTMYQTWADYHIKFLQCYAKEDIHFWGITTGNEPTTAYNTIMKINRLAWTPELHGKWIAENLGPEMQSKFPETKIMLLDDQRYLLPWAVQLMISEANNKYIDGIAIHAYVDDTFTPELLQVSHEMWPDKFILASEASIVGKKPIVLLGSWERGEAYSTDIIQDCRVWVIGWVDWNMALNLDGGPNWEENYVDCPIIVNATAGEFYKQPMYYHLGHFSKFVPEGSVRIDSVSDNNDLANVAFERPDGGVVLVILNKKDNVIPVSIFDRERGVAKVGLSKRSITTILYW